MVEFTRQALGGCQDIARLLLIDLLSSLVQVKIAGLQHGVQGYFLRCQIIGCHGLLFPMHILLLNFVRVEPLCLACVPLFDPI